MDSPGVTTAAANATAMGPATTYDLSGKSLLTAVLILLSAVLLLLFSHAFARWYLARRIDRRSRRRRLLFAAAAPPPPGGDRGLNAAILSSLPILPFAAGAGGNDEEYGPDECAVCLCEFEAGDGIRVLPQCGHIFHAECIDMWFYSHSTCPLCRCAVDPAAGGGLPGGDLREICRREEPPAAAPDPVAWEEGGLAADPVEEEEEKGLLGGWAAAVRHIFSWELGFQCGCAGGGGGDLEMGEGRSRGGEEEGSGLVRVPN